MHKYLKNIDKLSGREEILKSQRVWFGVSCCLLIVKCKI